MLSLRRMGVAAAIALLGCRGEQGPTGPRGAEGAKGPEGPAGEAGPGTRVVLTGTIAAAGSVIVQLPVDAGTIEQPPAVACYVGSTSSPNVWLVVASAPSTSGLPSCGLTASSRTARPISAAIINAQPGSPFAIVVVY